MDEIKLPFSNAHEMNQKFFNFLNSILSRNGKKNISEQLDDFQESEIVEDKPISNEPTSLTHNYFGNSDNTSEIGQELLKGDYLNE